VVRNDPFKTGNHHHNLVDGWITALGIGTQLEYDVGKYSIDIYVPDLELGIEIDGPYHLRKRDAKRDAYITENFGIEMWRISIKDINASYKKEFIGKLLERVQEME